MVGNTGVHYMIGMDL